MIPAAHATNGAAIRGVLRMFSVRWGCLLALSAFGVVPLSAQYPWPPMPGGSMRIRTPFWNLDINPYEGTTFQSPYGAFRAPPGAFPAVPPAPPFPPFGGYPAPYDPVQAARPVYPQFNHEAPLAHEPSMPPESLPDLIGQLAVNAEQLRRALERHPQGESWLRYLDPVTVHRFASQAMAQQTADLTSTERSQLESLLGHYKATLNSPEFRWVVALPGYQETLQRLERWLTGQASSPSAELSTTPRSMNPPPLPQPPISEAAPQAPVGPQPLGPQPQPRHPESRLEQLPAPNPVSNRRGSI